MLKSEVFQENLLQVIIVSLIFLLISGLITWAFIKKGFFKVPSSPSLELKIRGIDVLRGFGYFLGTEIGLISAIYMGSHYGMWSLDLVNKGWLNLMIIYASACMVALAYFELKPDQKRALWNRKGIPWYQAIKAGLINLVIFYFPVIVLGSIVSWVVAHYFDQEPKDQQAVEFLREAAKNPFQLFFTIIAVTILAPFKEEFLFRGLLQSWLKQKLGYSSLAIILASLVFALFHYTSSQELSNIALLWTLFVLSCGLGFIFEKEGSLWASIAMHSGFNMSQLALFFIT